MKYKTNSLITETGQIKTFYEKNNKMPRSCTLTTGETITPYSIAYLLSVAIQDTFKQSRYDLINVRVYDPTKKYNDTISNEDVLKDDYLVMIDNFLKFSRKYHRVPRFITTTKSKTKVSFELYLYCLSKIAYYFKQNNALPQYCNFNKGYVTVKQSSKETSKNNHSQSTSKGTNTTNCKNPYTSKPHYTETGCNKLGQCTSYYCGPHSIHQAIRKFGITKYSEKQIASWCGTTTAGTDHQGINTAITKISKETKIKLTVEWKNFSDMGNTIEERFTAIAKLLCQPNKAILWHILYDGKYGHYECIDKININTKYVRALNSLGVKKSDGTYPGYLQDRPYNTQASYARNTPGGQPSICIITKG